MLNAFASLKCSKNASIMYNSLLATVKASSFMQSLKGMSKFYVVGLPFNWLHFRNKYGTTSFKFDFAAGRRRTNEHANRARVVLDLAARIPRLETKYRN